MTDERNQTTQDEDWAMERPPQAPPGVYPAVLTGMTRKLADEGTPDERSFIVWAFTLEGVPEDVPPICEATSSMTLSVRGKAWPWIVALVGKATALSWERIGANERRQMVGRECMVNVVHNDDGYAKVEAVMTAQRKPVAASVPMSQEPDDIAF